MTKQLDRKETATNVIRALADYLVSGKDDDYEKAMGILCGGGSQCLPFDHAAIGEELKTIRWASWVHWVAMDGDDGGWYAFEDEPTKARNIWIDADGKFEIINALDMPNIPREYWQQAKWRVR